MRKGLDCPRLTGNVVEGGRSLEDVRVPQEWLGQASFLLRLATVPLQRHGLDRLVGRLAHQSLNRG